MNRNFLSVIVATLFVSLSSFAGFLVEPILGYHSGKFDYKYLDTVNSGASAAGTMTGMQYGLGLGYKFGGGFTVGLDYLMASLDDKVDSSSSTSKIAQTAYFLTLGYDAGRANFGLGYGNSEATDDLTPKNKITGTAMKVFAGYEFMHHMAVALEYIIYTTNDSTPEGGSTVKTKDAFDSYNYSAMCLNFRFPFEFGGK